MTSRTIHLIAVLSCGCLPLTAQVPIPWSSPGDKVNLTSNGQPMDSGFTFELGVFNGSFAPTLENIDLWTANWSFAASTSYEVSTKSYASQHDADTNDAPFVNGKLTYVWGKRESAGGKEWILFRASNWYWPFFDQTQIGVPFPSLDPWSADQATAVIGQINPTRTPFLMKSASVRSYAQWQASELSGEPLNAPADDPDKDGTPNLLEFVYDTDPQQAAAPVVTPVALLSGHAVITIPRIIGHRAQCTVEVSGNLVNWQSGPAHTEVLPTSDQAALVVRDLTPLSPANPRRFIRLKVTLP